MISPSTEAQVAEVAAAVGHLARVQQRVCLGVLE
jgi:hypothetical protein